MSNKYILAIKSLLEIIEEQIDRPKNIANRTIAIGGPVQSGKTQAIAELAGEHDLVVTAIALSLSEKEALKVKSAEYGRPIPTLIDFERLQQNAQLSDSLQFRASSFTRIWFDDYSYYNATSWLFVLKWLNDTSDGASPIIIKVG